MPSPCTPPSPVIIYFFHLPKRNCKRDPPPPWLNGSSVLYRLLDLPWVEFRECLERKKGGGGKKEGCSSSLIQVTHKAVLDRKEPTGETAGMHTDLEISVLGTVSFHPGGKIMWLSHVYPFAVCVSLLPTGRDLSQSGQPACTLEKDTARHKAFFSRSLHS